MIQENSLVTSSFYVLRAPAQPVTDLSELAVSVDTADRLLRQWLAQPGVEDALFTASPSLYQTWCVHRDTQADTLPVALSESLWKYRYRMASRCTPFGLFAGVAAGSVTTHAQIKLGQSRTHARIDSAVQVKLAHAVQGNDSLRPQLGYLLNRSVYDLHDQYRYSDFTDDSDGKRHVAIVALEKFPALTALVEYLRASSPDSFVSFVELQHLLTSQGVPAEDTISLINTLIDAKFLLSELEPTVVGPLFWERLINRVEALQPSAMGFDSLPDIQSILQTESIRQSELSQLFKLINQLHLGPDHNNKTDSEPSEKMGRLVQIDLYHQPEANTLPREVVHRIGEQIRQLFPLRINRRSTALTSFAQRFHQQYGDQGVPLLLALDNESGVGYGVAGTQGTSAVLESLTPYLHQTPVVSGNRLDELCLAKYAEAMRNGEYSIFLTEADLQQAQLSSPSEPVARSWYAIGELLSSSAEAVNQGDFTFFLRSAGGPSAANLMGRFCHGDERIHQGVNELLAWEQAQHPYAILAEIAHLPQARTGNVVSRPNLRPYQIPYLCPPTTDDSHTLPVDDLWIAAPQGGRILLYSKRHGRLVLPRLTTAHNSLLSDDVYRFLCDLQAYDQSLQLSWSWGLLSGQPFLPRIMYGNLILGKAQWNLTADVLLPVETDSAFARFRQQVRLPRWVGLAEGDHELLLDLDFLTSRQILFREVKKRRKVRLLEWLATPDQCWVESDSGRHTAEFLLPFGLTTDPTVPPKTHFFGTMSETVTRSFVPGSEWLYLKLYIGEQSIDGLLIQHVGPLVDEYMAAGKATKWFFVRYYDPESHLRLRVQLKKGEFASFLDQLTRRLAPLLNTIVHRVQIDTYQRELERYGAPTIADCEALFHTDSDTIRTMLVSIQDTDEDERWLFALQNVDALLTDFALPVVDKKAWATQLQQQYLREHGADKELRKALNNQYRRMTATIQAAFNSESENVGKSLLRIRSARNRPIIAHIRTITIDTAPETETMKVLTSVVHMSLNRLLSANLRLSELFVYHCLARYYESLLARTNKAV